MATKKKAPKKTAAVVKTAAPKESGGLHTEQSTLATEKRAH